MTQLVAGLSDHLPSGAEHERVMCIDLQPERAGNLLIHRWQAESVAPLLIETSTRRNGNPDLHRAVQTLHREALAGNTATAETWAAALEPALREIYRYAYAYADAYAIAHATAHDYAMANDYGEEGAAEFAESYAKLNTGANAKSFADANAIANARAMAAAFAAGDAEAYAETWPAAWLQACALAHAGDDGAAPSAERLQASYRQLADGLLAALAELPAPRPD
ncbi:SpcZ [Chitinimonas koreensis]|uniref:SpcZ n=1 Tax=Chitinimonas koreensis TaxID=356302 RepID=UPI00146FC2CB|nr:SpcZ [Chitinimonas koreensis]